MGLLGCGDIAAANLQAIGAAPNVELTACFDQERHVAENLVRSHSAVVAASAEELVSRSDVDAVLIAVPHDLHAPLAELAIAAGRHVIVEKPLAQDLPTAARIVTSARLAGVTLSVLFPHRYEPDALIAKRLIEAGVLGEFGGSAIRLYLDKAPSYWIGGYSGRVTSDWRSSHERAGGGVLIMNVSHYIDLFRHLLTIEVDDVSAVLGATDEERDVEDFITVGLRYAGGGIGSIVPRQRSEGRGNRSPHVGSRRSRHALPTTIRLHAPSGAGTPHGPVAQLWNAAQIQLPGTLLEPFGHHSRRRVSP